MSRGRKHPYPWMAERVVAALNLGELSTRMLWLMLGRPSAERLRKVLFELSKAGSVRKTDRGACAVWWRA